MILQESEIVEVLYKQDVDLGFTLAPAAKAASSKGATASSSGTSDETEKLNALRDLKEGQVCID